MTKRTYSKKDAPRLGLLCNSVGAFSEEGKKRSEAALKKLFNRFKREGIIARDSIWKDRISAAHEARAAAKEFGAKRVDVILILNSAFPNGQVFAAIAADPYLRMIPLIVAADYEAELGNAEWTTNAWCGVIMNNYAARQMKRYIRPLAGSPATEEFADELGMLLNVYNTVRRLREEHLVRFGEAPSGFHSASGDQLAYLEKFGVLVDTCDLTEVVNCYTTMTAQGSLGEASFTKEQVEKTASKMLRNKLCLMYQKKDVVEKAARMYHAFRIIIEANGYTGAAFRCWPELMSDYVHQAVCYTMTSLLADGVVASTACESDWPTAVAQSVAGHLAGTPGACLDFVNFTGGSEIVQLGHCGVGIPGLMCQNSPEVLKRYKKLGPEKFREEVMTGKIRVSEAIFGNPARRQEGAHIEPVLIGQFQYGPKTGIGLVQDAGGRFKMLAFAGTSDESTAKGTLYSAADVRVKEYRQLNRLILREGFSHHLAVAMADVSKELKELCAYYDIDYFNPAE
jgi:L-fucose isomerase-like protein